ncbi:MAG: acyl-CoA dehydrogenase family protein [Acidimicrobiales bacterium]
MDLELTEEQRLLHDTTARFIDAELPISRVRLLHDDPLGYDRGWLRQGADLGWFAMLVPVADGGGSVSGAGLIDATIIAEELGRHVQPGPFLPMNVVASAVAEHGSDSQRRDVLPALVAGELVATWAVVDAAGNWDGGRSVDAVRTDDGFSLSGTRGFVQDAQGADLLLVAGAVGGTSAQFLVPTDATGVTITPLAGLDLSRRMAEVNLDHAAGTLLGEIGADDAIERQLQVALVLLAADTVGVIDAMFEMTVAYSKDRVAFGRPIGSFQALKHVMADLGLSVETCKAGAAAAAAAVEARQADAAEVVSMVSAYIGDIATDVSQDSLQIHGGIGYTWEHDLHLLIRRARTNSALYGEPAWHRERVCAVHGL